MRMRKQQLYQKIINININIEATVGEMDELSEKIKLLLKSINEE